MGRLSAGLGVIFIALIAALVWLSLEFLPATGFFPMVRIDVAPGTRLEFLLNGHAEVADCQARVAAMQAAVGKNCPSCRITTECRQGLDAAHRRALGGAALDATSLRISGGTLLVHAADTETAMQICAGVRAAQATAVNEVCAAPQLPRSYWHL